MNIDRFSTNKYPQFQKEVTKKITSTFKDMPLELAKKVLIKMDADPEYEFSQQEFLGIYKNYLSEKVQKVLYFDSPDAVEHTVTQILLIIGAEQSFTMYQFVLAYIALNI